MCAKCSSQIWTSLILIKIIFIPGWQKHLNPSSWSTHIPWTHGDDSHSFKLCWHNGPVKPGGHSHLKGNVEFAFLLMWICGDRGDVEDLY